MFERRFAPLWKASKGVTVAGPIVLFGKLAEMVDREELTPQHAERLAGFIALQSVRHRRAPLHSRTSEYRRRLELRELGLVLSDGGLEEQEVDVLPFFDAAMDANAGQRD